MSEIIKKHIGYNHSPRNGTTIKYIVLHDTGNTGKGADAMAHFHYFNGGNRSASAHYFVDDKQIVELVPLERASWHCGDGRGKHGITNSNSIGIEMCIHQGVDSDKVLEKTIWITKKLMADYSVPLSRVVRHYDASGKSCPNTWRHNDWQKWHAFKSILSGDSAPSHAKGLDGTITASVLNIRQGPGTSYPVVGTVLKGKIVKVSETKNGWHNIGTGWVHSAYVRLNEKVEKPVSAQKSAYYEKGNLKIIETTADNIYIAQMRGHTLRSLGVYGINGTFFDTPNAHKHEACWGLAVNGGKPIGPNAGTNGHSRPPKGTIWWDGKTVRMQRVRTYTELPGVQWAISGGSLLPDYIPKIERWGGDVLRVAQRTGLAYKGDKVYLIVSPTLALETFRNQIKQHINPDGAIFLDGGGSTQMFYPENRGIHSSRRLNNLVGLRGI